MTEKTAKENPALGMAPGPDKEMKNVNYNNVIEGVGQVFCQEVRHED